MHPEQRAFIDAIIANPEDDAPRLVYADWLDEHDDQMSCPTCNGDCQVKISVTYVPNNQYTRCQTCNGSGCVPNLFAERAAFIRKQLELPDVDNCFCGVDGIYSDAHYKFDFRLAQITVDGSYIHKRFVYRRGFVYKIACTMNSWLDNGQEIVRDHPITRVEITDKKPSYYGGYGYVWYHLSHGGEAIDSLPDGIFRRLYRGKKKVYINAYSVSYGDDIAASIADLSQACIAWAKDQN